MRDDQLWIDVTDLMQKGNTALGQYVAELSRHPQSSSKVGEYAGRLSKLLGITDVDLHVEEVTGLDKTVDIVVDIFNRVNSGGTKLSQGDLALARICADWPEARGKMQAVLGRWAQSGFRFSLDWLVRSVNTILTGEARFSFLHDKSAAEIMDGLDRAVKRIDTCLNLIGGRLGLDHDEVLFGKFAIPVIVRFLDNHPGPLDVRTQEKLLFWFVQAAMWGRFSGSTESVMFAAWSVGARFYPVLYMLTRMGQSMDWGTGLPLRAGLLGRMNSLEVHHIFPKAQLYQQNLGRPDVNALGNFCFLTKDANLQISDKLPEDYFPQIEARYPGALASQWIPMDPELWKIKRYREFLSARQQLLADEANRQIGALLHGDLRWLQAPGNASQIAPPAATMSFAHETEEQDILDLNDWVQQYGLPKGQVSLECSDPQTNTQRAIIDLAWPSGIQEGLSRPIAVMLNESADALQFVNQLGYRYFSDIAAFKAYVLGEIVGGEVAS